MTSLREAEENARSIVNKFTAGAIGASFVPGSTLILVAADAAMVNEIAICFGCGSGVAEGFIASLATTAAAKTGLNAILEFIPVAKQIVAGTGTKALGELAIQFFKSKSPYR
jgi:hypothetical protein